MYFKIGALKNFADFTGKIHVLESLFKKASDTQAYKFIKKRLQHRHLLVKLAKFSSAFFTEYFRWLVFKISNSNILFKGFSGIPPRRTKSLITCNSHNDKLNSKIYSLTKIHVLESLFKKASDTQACNLLKRDSNTGIYLWNWQNFQALFLQNTSGGWLLE